MDPILGGTDSRPRVLDLFAAPGGFSLGFRMAGFKILAVVDNDPWGSQTLFQNFEAEETVVIQADLQDLAIYKTAEVIIGGPPCQSFSMVGRPKINHLRKQGRRARFIDDKRNRLYKQFVRIVSSVKPEFFIMENVPGIVSYNEGEVRDQIIDDFDGLGYNTEV